MSNLKKAGKFWMRAGEKAASILGLGIFAILFWTVLAPFALFAKFRKKELLPRLDDTKTSWYFPCNPTTDTLDSLKRQG